MIASFQHKGLKKMFEDGNACYVDAALRVRAARILFVLDASATLAELAVPGFRLHSLEGHLQGAWSITVSGNWRVTFRFVDGKAYDVDLVDYH